MELIPDGSLDLADSHAVWTHAFTSNGAFPDLADGACADLTPPSDNLDCGRVTFGIESADAGKATVTLKSPDLDVEGWQIAVSAEGCTIAGSLDGTRGADTLDGGARSGGYGRVDPANGGVVSAVALS